MTNTGSTKGQSGDWKTRTYMMSGLLGLGIGLIAAYLYVRVTDENGGNTPGQIKTMDLIGLAVALLALIRQITDLGTKGSK